MLGIVGVLGAALFFGAIGVSAIIRPRNLLQGFSIEAIEPESRNEIRAVYGGFPMAVAALLIFSLTRPDLSDGILFALASASVGMALGRIVSVLIDRKLGRDPAIYIVLELIVALMIASNISGL
jgi:Domain of unknown function (DUF4345)